MVPIVIGLLATTIGVAGCAANRTAAYRTPFAWRHETPEPGAVMDSVHPDVVRVTTTSGGRYVLEGAFMAGDSLGGRMVPEDDTPPRPGFRVAIRDIAKLEWFGDRSDDGPDIGGFLKGLGVFLGVAALVVVAAFASL